MDRGNLKIFLACALGAGVGTSVALSVSVYFWWIGMIVGGFVGYLSYEFKAVVRAGRQAWQSVVRWRQSMELKAAIKFFFWFYLLASSASISLILPLFLLLELEMKLSSFILLVALVIAGGSIFATSLIILDMILDSTTEEILKEKERTRLWLRKFVNPVSVYFYWLPRGVYFGGKRLIQKSPIAIITFFRFIKTVFVLIHSEIRLLCGVDAAIGTVIGYFSDHVLIGAIAGGIIGVLNFELISKRLFHIVPARRT